MASAKVIENSFLASACCASMDTLEKLADSSFTVQWLLEALNESDAKFQQFMPHYKIQKVCAVDISQGKGFASKVYNVTIHLDGLIDPYAVILKVPGVECLREVQASANADEGSTFEADQIAVAHNRECSFYDNYAAHIDIPIPKMYKTVEWVVGEHEGALLMESMFGKAECMPLWTGCNLQQVYNVAKHLATLMAHFLCLPKERWERDYKTNLFSSLARVDFFAPFYAKLKEMKPGVFDEALDVFGRYVKSKKFFIYGMHEVGNDYGLPSVLIHGDLWSNNMMWKKNVDGSIANELAAIIDWQVVQEGSITTDLARFITFCVDGEVRREHQYEVLQYYYDTIVKLVKAEGKTVDFTIDQMKEAYKVNCACQSSQVIMMPATLFPNKDCSPQEAHIREAQLEKIYLRCQLAMEDALEVLKEIPDGKLID